MTSRIIIDENVLRGKPIIRGTRIAVELILELLSNDWSIKTILENYPQLVKEDILESIKFAHTLLVDNEIHELHV
jgi:uncharacterized protein (DUF433 family)